MASLPSIVHILYAGVGGEAGVVFPLASAAAAQSRQHAIFYGIEPVAEANIRRCEELNITWHGVRKSPGLDQRSQQEITRLLLEIKPVAVIVHTLGTLPACLKAKRKLPRLRIIAVEHHSNALKSTKRWLLSFIALWRADRVVYLTEAYRQEVADKLRSLFSLRSRRTIVIGNSLNLAHYQPATTRAQDRFVFGMQGRMVEGKDFAILLRALVTVSEQCPVPLHLELIGDGPLRLDLEALALELGIADRVTFCGMLSTSDLIARMRKWHAYVHASLGETMSIAIMEAKACGLAIIATEAPGVSGFFQNGHNGLVVPAGDAHALAQHLCELQRRPELRQCLGEAARLEAEDCYSSREAWQAYAQLFVEPEISPLLPLESIHQLPV